ncbi:hypothetical protein HT031_006102 [Scenedesmus sp. PABB004]|nr:hypothetical protein HT031_006102 [Scenedesmus sp. PABB004]
MAARRLPAGDAPHVAIAGHSLPPGVGGAAQGELVVLVTALDWAGGAAARRPPAQLQLRVRWWGCDADTVVPFAPGRGGAGAAFPLAAGPRGLSRYLGDAGVLRLALEACPSGRPVATVEVDLARLAVGAPLEAALPARGPAGQRVATAAVRVCVDYAAPGSASELGEHLATTDGGVQLPLPPAPRAAPAAAGEQPGRAAGKENAGGAAGGGGSPALKKPAAQQPMQQQQQQQQPPQLQGQQQQQQQQQAAPPVLADPAAAAPAAPASPGGRREPLADIVRRAEGLKAAMDRAAARGVSVALPGAAGLPWGGTSGGPALWQPHGVSALAAALLPPLLPQLLLPGGDDPAAGWRGAGADSPAGSSGSSAGGSRVSELEDLEELEDLLLQELLRARAGRSPAASPARQRERRAASQERRRKQHEQPSPAAAAAAASLRRGAPGAAPPDGQGAALLKVELLGVSGVAAPGAGVTAVVKSGGRTCCELDVGALLVVGGGGGAPVSAIVSGPPCLAGPLLPADRPCLAIELWAGRRPGGAAGGDCELLGIARLPLQQPRTPAAAAGAAREQPCFAAGSFELYDVLRGRAAGALEARVLRAASSPTASPPSSPAAGGGAAGAAAASASVVVGVRHVIDVTLHSASALPDGAALRAGGQAAPESRFMAYSFPGEEALFTKEVGCVAAPVFAAHAQHAVLLPPGRGVAEALGAGTGEDEALCFELWDKWSDDSDSLVAAGSLPLAQVLALAQVDHPGTSESSGVLRAFLVPLALEPGSGEAAVQQAGRPVLLQVSVRYSATHCYSRPQAGSAASSPARGAASPAPCPGLEQSPTRGGSGGSSPTLSGFASPVLQRTPARGAPSPGAGARPASPAWQSGAAAAPPSAELSVQIIRACGLQAAVKDAERGLGGASGLLGRAAQLGPHPFATLRLFPGGSGASEAPAIRTAFQAQTFCPQFHHQALVPLQLNGPTLAALASQDCCVEVWHHCPRSQAVAAALARGQSSSYGMAGQQQVLLGSASCPLQGLLTRPQGVACWLTLTSRLGQPVGAVEVALRFSSIGGHELDACPAAACPLARFPELRVLLPPEPAAALAPLLASPPEGFDGQLARLSVHVEELLLPGGDEALTERPRIASYAASQLEAATPSKAASSAPCAAGLLARAWRVDWGHVGRHWVVADWRLGRALLAYPLVLSVAQQEPASARRGGAGGAGAGAAGAPLGTAEVDLSPLLAPRGSGVAARPGARWLGGVFALVHPMPKTLGGTRLRLKVLLELEPREPPPDALLADPAALWQVGGPLAALPPPGAGAGGQRAATPGAGGDEARAGGCEPPRAVAVPAAASPAGRQLASGASSRAASPAAHPPWASPAGSDAAEEQLPSVARGDDEQPLLELGRPRSGGRLRAEVSHVSAPGGGSRSISPAGAAAPELGGRALALALAPQRPEQQQLVALDPARQLGVRDVRLCVEGALNLQLPELGGARRRGKGVGRRPRRAAPAPRPPAGRRVLTARGLPPRAPRTGAAPCLYVAYRWPEAGGALLTTPLVAAWCGPLGHTASAKWLHAVHLPLALDTAGAEELVLQVWLRRLPSDGRGEVPPLYAGLAAAPRHDDELLGAAALDLAALRVLGALDGWHHIADAAGRPRGQIKASVTHLTPHAAPEPPALASPRRPGGLLLLPAPPPAAAAPPSPSGAPTDAGGGDLLRAALRANLEALDEFTASLATRSTGSETASAAGSSRRASSPAAAMPDAAAASPEPEHAAAMAARAAAFQHVQTLSDDEEFLVAPGGAATESEPDTEELMGRVDWSLAANSDDEAPPGPPRRPAGQQQAQHARPPVALGALGAGCADWMFDITRPSGPPPDAALSQAGAAAAATASAARLAELEGAQAHAAAAQAAAAARQAERRAADGAAAGAGADAAPPRPGGDVWRHLAELEDAEDTAAAAAQQQRRAQPQQQPAGAPGELQGRGQPAARAAAPGASGGGGPLDGEPGSDSDDDLAACMPAARVSSAALGGQGGGVAFANALPPVQPDFSLEYSDAPHHWRRGAPAAAAGAPAAQQPTQQPAQQSTQPPAQRPAPQPAQSRWDDEGVVGGADVPAERVSLPAPAAAATQRRVAFANALPPVQDDPEPATSAAAPRRRAAATQHTPPPAGGSGDGGRGGAASHPGMTPATRAAAAAAVAAAASAAAAGAAGGAAAAGGGARASGLVPVLGRHSDAALEDLFSISKRRGSPRKPPVPRRPRRSAAARRARARARRRR